MRKRKFEEYKAITDERIERLEATVDFLAKNGRYDIEFVYKNDEFKSTLCYAKYVFNGLVETALIETYPYSTVKSHRCIENNPDFAVITSNGFTYRLDKRTKRCTFIKEKHA
jgi:hypothetical protein